MTDTIIKGTGNSRTLRTVPNAPTLYPTHEAMIEAMRNGTFPIDIGPLNLAGLDQEGTALTKANLLSDETAGLYGLNEESTVNQVLSKIPANIGSIAKLGNCKLYTTSYVGTGVSGPGQETSISFPNKPIVVFITNNNYQPALIYGSQSVVAELGYEGRPCTLTWTSRRLTMRGYSGYPNTQFNTETKTYRVAALLDAGQ